MATTPPPHAPSDDPPGAPRKKHATRRRVGGDEDLERASVARSLLDAFDSVATSAARTALAAAPRAVLDASGGETHAATKK